jgi:ribosomal protein L11 methyltransferase
MPYLGQEAGLAAFMNRRSAKAPSYIKVTFDTPAALADEAAGLLVSRGALGCAVEKMRRPGARPGKSVTLCAYFHRLSASGYRALHAALARAGMLARDGAGAGPQRLVDPGWASAWKERFEPLKVGRRILIVPPWNPAETPGRISLVIEPGQGFGTGHHPTTRGALRVLEELCARREFRRALDVGTGSGILALAMYRMGIRSIRAVDVDRTALDNARKNARLNRLEGRVHFSATPVSRLKSRFDLVVANILGSTLIEIAPALKRLVAEDGCLVLGGILNREADSVATAYAPELRVVKRRTERGWTTTVLER